MVTAVPFATKFPIQRILIGTLLVLGGLYAISVSSTPHKIGQMQFVLFPFFAATAYHLAQRFYKLPKSFFIILCVIGLGVTAMAYSKVTLRDRTVFVAILKDDATGGVSRKLRKRIEQVASLVGGAAVKQIYEVDPHQHLSNDKHPKQLFEVSGDQKLLTLTFGQSISFQSLSAVRAPVSKVVKHLRIVTDVPQISLSWQPYHETAKFIGFLSSHDELGWEAAGNLETLWASQSHRGYPWFKQGTQYLLELASGTTYEPALADCAYRSFMKALRYASPHDGRMLRMAVTQNLGVLLYIQSVAEKLPRYKEDSIKYFKWASYGFPRNRQKGVWYVGTVARKNLAAIQKSEKPHKHVKR